MAHIELHAPAWQFNLWSLLPTRRNLTTELTAIGITPIDQARVDAHIAADCEDRRQTFDDYLLALLFDVRNVVTFYLFAKLLLPQVKIMIRSTACALATFILAVVWMIWLHNYAGYWDVVFLVPALAFFGGFLALELVPDLRRTVSRWEKDYLCAYVGYPKAVDETADTVTREIPGAKIFVVHDDRDPFLQVEIGLWPFRQKATVEAWSTGDPSLDTLHNGERIEA